MPRARARFRHRGRSLIFQSERARALEQALVAAGTPGLLPTYDMLRGTHVGRLFTQAVMQSGFAHLDAAAWPHDGAFVSGVRGELFREGTSAFYRLPDGTLVATEVCSGWVHVQCAGPSLGATGGALSMFQTLYPATYLSASEDRVPITFWMYGRYGPERRLRMIDASPWAEIERNYTATVRTELGSVMSDFEPGKGGLLLLWQGPAGTGKTWALRALVSEWLPWCFVPSTSILMADWTEKPIEDIQTGDEVMSYKDGQYVASRILAGGRRVAPTVRVVVEGGETRCTPDHKFHVAGRSPKSRKQEARNLVGERVRRSKLRGWRPETRTTEYDRGYLQGALAGDGSYDAVTKKVRWEVKDREFAERISELVNEAGHNTTLRERKRSAMNSRWSDTYCVVSTMRDIEYALDLPCTREEKRGYIAGFFDSEGTVPASGRQLAMDQVDDKPLHRVEGILHQFGFNPSWMSRARSHRLVVNGVAEVERFMETFRPVITRKRLRHRQQAKFLQPSLVTEVVDAGEAEVVNIETTVGNYFADGFLVDNCEFHYITDPDAFFVENASYMVDVLLSESYQEIDEPTGMIVEGDPKGKWRVLILEDTGELLSAGAKEKYGQGLSRLLNVVDGLIGQGLRVLVLVTTNDELGELNPAVRRPGRCASQIVFSPLTDEEAAAWLGGEADAPTTLAELYARSDAGQEALSLADEAVEEPEAPEALEASPVVSDELARVARAHAPEDGYGETAWNEETGTVFWVAADWTSNDELDAARDAFLAIDGVESFDSEAEAALPSGEGWVQVWPEAGSEEAYERVLALARRPLEFTPMPTAPGGGGRIEAAQRTGGRGGGGGLAERAIDALAAFAGREAHAPTIHVHMPHYEVEAPQIQLPAVDIHVEQPAATTELLAAASAALAERPDIHVHVPESPPAEVHVASAASPDVHVHVPEQQASDIHVHVPETPLAVEVHNHVPEAPPTPVEVTVERPRPVAVRVERDPDGTKVYVPEEAE